MTAWRIDEGAGNGRTGSEQRDKSPAALKALEPRAKLRETAGNVGKRRDSRGTCGNLRELAGTRRTTGCGKPFETTFNIYLS